MIIQANIPKSFNFNKCFSFNFIYLLFESNITYPDESSSLPSRSTKYFTILFYMYFRLLSILIISISKFNDILARRL